MAKIWPSPIFKKNFFPAENAGNMPEIAVFAHFHWTFSVYFLFFFTVDIVNSNSQYFVKIAGTADCRAGKNGFSSISRVLLIISFMNFCSILSLNLSFVCSFVRSFFTIFSINVYVFSLCLTFTIR